MPRLLPIAVLGLALATGAAVAAVTPNTATPLPAVKARMKAVVDKTSTHLFNTAGEADPAFAAQTKEFSTRLLAILRDAKDPRVTGDGGTFDRSPFSDPEVVPSAAAKKGGKKAAK